QDAGRQGAAQEFSRADRVTVELSVVDALTRPFNNIFGNDRNQPEKTGKRFFVLFSGACRQFPVVSGRSRKKHFQGFLLGALAAVLASGVHATSLPAQDSSSVTVVDVGPGASGRIIQQALARPHRLVEPDSSWFI